MKGTTPLALVALVSLSGCPDDDPVPSADASTTGETDSNDASSTGPGDGLDDTAGDSGSTSSATAETEDDESTTTGEPAAEGVRFILRQPIEGTDFFEYWMHEYAEGELLDPVLVTDNVPAGGGASNMSYTGAVDASMYCVTEEGQPGHTCYAVDLSTRPPGAPQAISGDPLVEGVLLSLPSWREAMGAFTTMVFESEGPVTISSIPFADGVVGQAETLVAEGPGEEFLTQYVIDRDGEWLGYQSRVGEGPRSAFVVPLGDPSGPVMISDLVDPIETAQVRAFVPEHDAVIYTVDDSSVGATDQSIWWVDLSGALPGEPIRIDDPLADDLEVRRPQIAPDGSGLVYWVGDGLEGDLMYVDLSSGVPQLPVVVSTLGASQVLIVDYGWSPDSRWIVYHAAHEQPDTHDLYVADASGDTLGAPMQVNAGLTAGSDIAWSRFDDTSSWLYYVGAEGEMFPRLYRTPLTDLGPGQPQSVSGEEGWNQGDIVPSHDWSMLAYTAEGDIRELYLVDISGDTPGTPTRLNAPPTENAEVSFGPRFSSDDSVVVYDETATQPQGPRPAFLVDLETMEVHRMADDASGAVAIPN